MPWHLESDNSACSGWAVVKDDDGEVVGCHPTKAKALKHLAALNINVKEEPMDTLTDGASVETNITLTDSEDRAMDDSDWDANRAMGACSSAADYRVRSAPGSGASASPTSVSTGRFPHHYLGQGPNAAGIAAARARFGQTEGLVNREAARRHLFETHSLPSDEEESSAPFPKESLYRAVWPTDFELREDDGEMPVMYGHFAVFDTWTEIDSAFEGNFMERIALGAFEKTFTERAGQVRVLFQHGKDPQVGSKVLGEPSVLREEERGAYYEVPLLDTSYNRDLLPGLRRGLYGSSFRFRVMREQIDRKPKRSEFNPEGLPERTIKEVELHEFGPVTFPAYASATAGVRSLTDEFLLETFVRDRGRLRKLIRYLEGEPSEDDAGEASEPVTSSEHGAGRGPVPATPRKVRDYLTPRKEEPSWTL